MKDKGNRHGAVGKSSSEVATNLRTGPYCCENTNLRTGLDQWTRQPMARGHARAITNDLPNEPVWCPHTRLGRAVLKNYIHGGEFLSMHAELTTKSHAL